MTNQAAVALLSLALFIPTANAQPSLSISVTTDPATGISDTGAVLNGTANGNGQDISAVYFDWGLSTDYDHVFMNAVPFNVPAADGETPVSLSISGLSCGTTYHFRVTADDMNGRNAKGEDLSFITSDCVNPAPERATPIPTMTSYSLVMTLAGLTFITYRRIRTSTKK